MKFHFFLFSNLLFLLGLVSRVAEQQPRHSLLTVFNNTNTVIDEMSFVPVGDLGNPQASDDNYGAVSYAYQIGKYNVTAEEYCAFLNAVAVTDMDHLYDEKLGSDPISACIVRSGKPGVYHYDVIAGREIFLISYTSLFDKARYCNAMPTGAEAMAWQANGEDIFLTSNRSDFCVTASSASQQLTVDWNKFMPKEGTWTEWESTTKGIIITASICFSLYRFIKYYKAVPTGEVINTESIRADVDTVGHNGARSFVEVPSRMENVDEEPSSEVSSSHGDEKEQKILTCSKLLLLLREAQVLIKV